MFTQSMERWFLHTLEKEKERAKYSEERCRCQMIRSIYYLVIFNKIEYL